MRIEKRNPKRKINPHKGGRTEILAPIRLTPDEKLIVQEAAYLNHNCYADWLVSLAVESLSNRRKRNE